MQLTMRKIWHLKDEAEGNAMVMGQRLEVYFFPSYQKFYFSRQDYQFSQHEYDSFELLGDAHKATLKALSTQNWCDL